MPPEVSDPDLLSCRTLTMHTHYALYTMLSCFPLTHDWLKVYKQAGHSYGVDWWATGVITCQLVAGFSPFAVESDNDWGKNCAV
jgi:hypothetical protein